MSDILAVISLIIAVSGAAFMAVSAMRDHWGNAISRFRERGEKDYDKVKGARNPATVQHGIRKKKQLDRRLYLWDIVAIVPTAAFFFTAYYIAIDTLATCWSAIPGDCTIWSFYCVWIIILLALNFAVLLILLYLFWSIKATSDDLNAHAEATLAERPPFSPKGGSPRVSFFGGSDRARPPEEPPSQPEEQSPE